MSTAYICGTCDGTGWVLGAPCPACPSTTSGTAPAFTKGPAMNARENAEMIADIAEQERHNLGFRGRIAEAVAQALDQAHAEGWREGLKYVADKCDGNARLCRELADKLAKNGQHAMAEMQRIRAEQTEGIATSIRLLESVSKD